MPVLTDIECRQWADRFRDGLLSDVLPFWLKHAIDFENGGITSSVNRDGTLIDSDKSVWQQGRFNWLLGELFNEPRLANYPERQTWQTIAEAGLEFLARFGFDPEDGRMWFHLTREGAPIRKRRYAYSESFAAIAFGEWAQATGNEIYYEQATRCFARFMEHQQRPRGVQPKFTQVRPIKSLGFPMITIVTAQQLRDSIDLPQADQLIEQAIDEIQRDFVKTDLQCVMESVGPAGEIIDHFDGRTLNPGHAIEAAWFILDEGRRRGSPAYQSLGLQMLDWMWERGWDSEYGGLLYFVDIHSLPVQEYWHDMKFWWPHNELIIATLLAFDLTGFARYADLFRTAADWSYQHFPDHEHGEWFGYLHRDGSVSSQAKGNLWKGPFHLPRMQLLGWRLLENRLDRGQSA